MSAERERRMCAALGIDISQRRRYWRPCLPDELTPKQRQAVVDFAQSLLER